jgi:hypothetical protein
MTMNLDRFVSRIELDGLRGELIVNVVQIFLEGRQIRAAQAWKACLDTKLLKADGKS